MGSKPQGMRRHLPPNRPQSPAPWAAIVLFLPSRARMEVRRPGRGEKPRKWGWRGMAMMRSLTASSTAVRCCGYAAAATVQGEALCSTQSW